MSCLYNRIQGSLLECQYTGFCGIYIGYLGNGLTPVSRRKFPISSIGPISNHRRSKTMRFKIDSNDQMVSFGFTVMWHGHLDIIFDIGLFYIEITIGKVDEKEEP